jgi:hypothetical protein
MNRAIEFYDSTLLSMKLDGELRVELSAYVHSSDGEPGRDAGSGWEQSVELVLKDPVVEVAPSGTVLLYDGSLHVDDKLASDLLPLPFVGAGTVLLCLYGAEGELRARGSHFEVVARGEARFIEKFLRL